MPSVYYMMPTFALRRQILAEIPSVSTTGHMADSVDFMVEQVEKIDRSTLASRLRWYIDFYVFRPNMYIAVSVVPCGLAGDVRGFSLTQRILVMTFRRTQ
eukprot:sb/3478749/